MPKGAVVALLSRLQPTDVTLDLKPTQQEGIYAWYCEINQPLIVNEVIDPNGEPIVVFFSKPI